MQDAEDDDTELDDDFMGDILGFRSPSRDFRTVYGPKDGDYRNLKRFSSSLVQFYDDSLNEPGNVPGLCLFLV